MTALRSRQTSWSADHIFISPGPMSDAFLVNVAAPFLKELDGAGDWFFIRYGERGPHLRIRVAVEHPDVAAQIHRRWREAAPAHVDAVAPLPVPSGDQNPIDVGSVRSIAYEPEIARYGGPLAMPLSERVFCRSTALSLGIIAATLDDMEQRIGQAIGIMIASVRSLTDDRAKVGHILSGHAAAWEHWFAAVDWPVAQAATPVVLSDPAAVEAALRAPMGIARSYGAAWHACLTALVRELAAQDTPPTGVARMTGIVLSHLHMFCNRLGISPAMEFHLAKAISAIARH